MTETLSTPWRYDRLTWPEMKVAIARKPQAVVAVPIGAVEDHGPHTPLSTDNDILEGVLTECGRQAAGDLLVLPTIPFGLDEHHMDFPGTITVDIETTGLSGPGSHLGCAAWVYPYSNRERAWLQSIDLRSGRAQMRVSDRRDLRRHDGECGGEPGADRRCFR